MPRLLIALVLCLGFIMNAHAAERDTFEANYAMYTGGFNVVAIDGFFTHKATGYELEMLAYTKGLLGKLAPWKGALETTGNTAKNGTYTPLSHRFSSWWRHKEERTTFTYNAKGIFQSMELVEDTGNIIKDSVPAELTDGTVDMLTGLATMLAHYKKTGNCNIAVPTFDGKRKFDLKFTDTGDATIKPGRYSIYSGTARTCTIEIVPKGGLWHDKPRGWMTIQEQAKAGKKLPKLWIAKPADDMPAIPVRFDVFTKYGDIVMHLTGLK